MQESFGSEGACDQLDRNNAAPTRESGDSAAASEKLFMCGRPR